MHPTVTYHKVKLPLTRLNYLKCGQGKPLIMVPATISEINNWLSLVQFVGQKYEVYFFELPGHGESTPFKSPFKSELLAETVEQFINSLGFKTVSLLGFSFGGILTLRTLFRLQDRVEKVVLMSPCVTHKALRHSPVQIRTMKTLASLMKSNKAQSILLKLIHNEKTVDSFIWLVRKIGDVEKNSLLKEKLLRLPPSTLKVLVHQVNEILTIEFQTKDKFNHPCYFAMSVNDPLLDFSTTKNTLGNMFQNLTTKEFDFPYHQPPKPFTYEELNNEYKELLELI